MIFRKSGSFRFGRAGYNTAFILKLYSHCVRKCAHPPHKTDSARPYTPYLAAKIGAVIMNTRLLNAGDNAGTKNDPNEFSSPIVSALRDIIIRNGNIHRVRLTAKMLLASSNPGAIIFTSAGAAAIPTPTTNIVAQSSTVIVPRAKARAFSRLLVSDWENTGTNAADKAPSASNCRARFERVYATLKASIALVAPKSAATITSRARPSIRLIIVPAIMNTA